MRPYTGQGLRLGEALGMEKGPRCADFLRRELHVVQQLHYSSEHRRFILSPPKAGSSGTVDLDPLVADHVAAHIRDFPPVTVDLVDITGSEPTTRTVELLFSEESGRPVEDGRWSLMWHQWREAAGWPKGGTFHSLRHFFATTMMSNGVDPQEVQKALRHASLRMTLEIPYVGSLPPDASVAVLGCCPGCGCCGSAGLPVRRCGAIGGVGAGVIGAVFGEAAWCWWPGGRRWVNRSGFVRWPTICSPVRSVRVVM